jgi:glycine oxidase
VIAGAGIIGLACALELAETGFTVTVVERGLAMQEASWAAAGMLAVDDPENPAALLPLSRLSRALYPEFLGRLSALSGVAVPLRTQRTRQKAHSGGGEFFLLNEVSLDPRDLCRALPPAVIAAGVQLREQCATVTVTDGRDGTDGLRVELADGSALNADAFVLACGAWSGQVRLPGAAAAMPIAPRKGQMVEVTMEVTGDDSRLDTVIRTPALYLVPRGDGRIVVGATVEDAGFDREVDAAAGDRLIQAAAELWPPILRGRVTARWTGLRPAVMRGVGENGLNGMDSLPVIGRVTPRVYAATGHFRNGILLAPGTARLIGECLRGEGASVPLEPFAASRFFPLELSASDEILIQTGV